MNTPPIVSPEEWEAARQQLLVKEKELTHARDKLAAERRRMPWLAVEKKYEFEGPDGKVPLLDLFDGRRQLIVYRAFFEPGVFGWPEHACRGCSLGADQVAHLAHLNARDTTLVYASRAPQADIARVKARLELPAAEKELARRRGCADEPAKPATLVTPTRSIACATSVSRPPTSRWSRTDRTTKDTRRRERGR